MWLVSVSFFFLPQLGRHPVAYLDVWQCHLWSSSSLSLSSVGRLSSTSIASSVAPSSSSSSPAGALAELLQVLVVSPPVRLHLLDVPAAGLHLLAEQGILRPRRLLVELDPSGPVQALQVQEAQPPHADAVHDQGGAQVDLEEEEEVEKK